MAPGARQLSKFKVSYLFCKRESAFHLGRPTFFGY
jgi:hypothetical protein